MELDLQVKNSRSPLKKMVSSIFLHYHMIHRLMERQNVLFKRLSKGLVNCKDQSKTELQFLFKYRVTPQTMKGLSPVERF